MDAVRLAGQIIPHIMLGRCMCRSLEVSPRFRKRPPDTGIAANWWINIWG